MNRKDLQSLAEVRIEDAAALLNIQRWPGAYYLAGYAVECGLKACVLRHVEDTGLIFGQKDGLKRLADCWTHDLEKLVEIANLKQALKDAGRASDQFERYWTVVKSWSEVTRYEIKSENEARALFEAITDPTDGVLKWIRTHW